MPVSVVTDSGSDLPPDLASSHRIVVVPLLVTFEDESFRRAADEGADAMVSVHLSAELSSTADHARMGARVSSVPIPVHVVDSRLVGVGLGLVALHPAGPLRTVPARSAWSSRRRRRSAGLVDRIAEACGVRPFVAPMGATIGAHLGPGAIGAAVLRKGETAS